MLSLERQIITSCRHGDRDSPFAIYANNRMVALRTALERNFPTLTHYCGVNRVRPLLREFCQRFPPRSPYLVFYGEQLANFFRGKRLFIEADLATLDYARLSALMAADVIAATPSDVTTTEQLDELRLSPTVNVSSCQRAQLLIWLTATEGALANNLRDKGDGSQLIDILFYRDAHQHINILLLDEPESLFLECLLQEKSLEQAATRVTSGYPEFSISDWFAKLLVMGAFYRAQT